MFPRLKKTNRKDRCYQYLVISESFRDNNGRSCTKDLASLGNVDRFSKTSIENLIDGLIRLFEIEEYGLSEEVEILSSLEHGSILLWRSLWQRLKLDEIVDRNVKRKTSRVSIAVAKYVEMMVVNRCVNPLSKLATSRWMDTTCYAALEGYSELSGEVQYFYRSMDYLLKAKELIEKAIYERMRNLFSVNVRLTFYDITSTFFYGGSCPLADNGFSRDTRPDKVQVVIGVVTSYEGYPLKHYVFEGNRQDQSTVREVVQDLRREYEIEQTIFVGDRGMISRLNLDQLQINGYDYIMGVKARQDEMMSMVLEDEDLFGTEAIEWRGLQIAERRIEVKEFLIWKIAQILELDEEGRRNRWWSGLCETIKTADKGSKLSISDLREELSQLGVGDRKKRQKIGRLLSKYRWRYEETVRLVCARNPKRAKLSERQRREKLQKLTKQIEDLFNGKREKLTVRLEKLFEEHKRCYRRFFKWTGEEKEKEPTGYEMDVKALAEAKLYDGVFVLTTNRQDLTAEKVVASYKNLQEVETLFDDLKHFVDVHPVRHWLVLRVRAHVFLCILALLLKRILEIDCLGSKALTGTLETVARSKLVKYRVHMSKRSDHSRDFWKVTKITEEQARCFAAVGIANPENLEKYVW